MKKILFLIMIFLLTTGCTIDLSDKDNNIKVDNNDKEEEVTKQKVEGKKSTVKSPLTLGDTGITSKFNVINNKYEPVSVKLVRVMDNSYIEDYNNENPDDKIKKTSGFKTIAIEYEVTLTNFKTESFGTDGLLETEILDVKGEVFRKDKVKQIIDIKVLNKDTGILENKKGSVIIAFQIPSNYSNYIVKLGTKDHEIAYFKL